MRFLLFVYMAFSPSLFAQSQLPRLVASVDDQKEPIQLSEMDVEVKILGEIAETRTTLSFYMTDIDLWVTEPTGEKAYYESTLTNSGGLVSEDFTEGYRPEEYAIRKAIPGKYLIQVDYFGSDSQRLQGPVTVQADVYTNYGRENEKRQRLTLRLEKEKDTYTVGEINF